MNVIGRGVLEADLRTETTAPLLTRKALDDYAAAHVQKLFGGVEKVVATVSDVVDHIDQRARRRLKSAGPDRGVTCSRIRRKRRERRSWAKTPCA